MTPSRDIFRSSVAGHAVARTFHAAVPSGSVAASLTRAGLPVVSNRAFINAWATRRNKLSASAHLVRSH